MIETKEQYEKIQRKGYAAMVVVTPVEISPLLEIIEALREVVRRADFRGHHIVARSPCGGEGRCNICDALADLPDWLKDG